MVDSLTQSIGQDGNYALSRYVQHQNNIVSQRIDNASVSNNNKAIEEAAQDFEAVFMAEMLKPMFEQIKPNGMFGGGKGEEVFQGMMVQEYGKIMAERGGIGIAEQVKEEMLRIQEQVNKGRSTADEEYNSEPKSLAQPKPYYELTNE